MNISTVIPCHNAEKYIKKALESVANQTFKPFEIIVVNDASTDHSKEIVTTCGIPVKLIEVNLKSAGAARNVGIESAKGDWIAFLDADDYWYPHHLKEAVSFLEQSGDPVYMCHLDAMSVDEKEIYRFEPRWKLKTSAQNLSHDTFFDLFSEKCYFSANGVVQLRKRILEVGGYDIEQKQRNDIDQFMRVLAGQTWSWNAKPGWCYRVDTPGSLSRNLVGRDYYMLRSLLKNRSLYSPAMMDSMIQIFAKKALSIAISDGSQNDIEKAKNLGFKYLKSRHKFIFTIAIKCPRFYRCLIKIKRRWALWIKRRWALWIKRRWAWW